MFVQYLSYPGSWSPAPVGGILVTVI